MYTKIMNFGIFFIYAIFLTCNQDHVLGQDLEYQYTKDGHESQKLLADDNLPVPSDPDIRYINISQMMDDIRSGGKALCQHCSYCSYQNYCTDDCVEELCQLCSYRYLCSSTCLKTCPREMMNDMEESNEKLVDEENLEEQNHSKRGAFAGEPSDSFDDDNIGLLQKADPGPEFGKPTENDFPAPAEPESYGNDKNLYGTDKTNSDLSTEQDSTEPLTNTQESQLLKAKLMSLRNYNTHPSEQPEEEPADSSYETPTSSSSTTPSAYETTSELHAAVTDQPNAADGDPFRPDPDDCHSFILFNHGFEYKIRCPHPLRWNQFWKTCDWEENVKC